MLQTSYVNTPVGVHEEPPTKLRHISYHISGSGGGGGGGGGGGSGGGGQLAYRTMIA